MRFCRLFGGVRRSGAGFDSVGAMAGGFGCVFRLWVAFNFSIRWAGIDVRFCRLFGGVRRSGAGFDSVGAMAGGFGCVFRLWVAFNFSIRWVARFG